MENTDYYTGITYQELFNHMSKEHGLILLQSEMDYIISLVRKIDDKPALKELLPI